MRTTREAVMSPPNSSSRLTAQGLIGPAAARRGMPYSASSVFGHLRVGDSPSGLSNTGLISSPAFST